MGRGGHALTAFVDTNVLIRHLTGDPPSQASRATSRLRNERVLLLADVVVAECAFVLEKLYRVEREVVARLLRSLLALPSIRVVYPELLRRALTLYETSRLSFPDVYLTALAELSGVRRVLTFDRALGRIPRIERIEP